MKLNLPKLTATLVLVCLVIFSPLITTAQYAGWYQSAQQRIDTLRKGTFGINIFDKDGQPFTGPVSVRMKKHEFPFGIAFDFYEGGSAMGSPQTSIDLVQATEDVEIYRTRRWANFLAYALPAEKGKEYELTLKFAEIIFATEGTRLFNVYVEGQLFLEDFNPFTAAGGKGIAIDKTLLLVTTRNEISIEIIPTSGVVTINGIVLKEKDGEGALRINCGGPALITADGNSYITEAGLFDHEANPVASLEQ